MRRHRSQRRAAAIVVGGYLVLATAVSCGFDSGLRWVEPPPEPATVPLCQTDAMRCTDAVERCQQIDGVADWVVVQNCADQGKVCAPNLWRCTTCIPDATFCNGQEVALCSSDGESFAVQSSCDPSQGHACRDGGCPHLCTTAREEKSNVGCEYWAVDLDNAMIDASHNAAAQQFAVVISNPQPDVPVQVRVFQDEGAPGDPAQEVEIASAVIAPLNLRVFKLGPREVDGSPEPQFDTGTHSAVTRHAYKVTSDFPVVAYQFNPLENVNVFSNDASLLKPREALSYDTGVLSLSYVVASWPQTIAVTDDPNTNFSSAYPINLRSFLTVVGTAPDTKLIIHPSTNVRGGDGVPAVQAGGTLELTIGAYDVVNLETPDLNSFAADFTGTRIEANGPIAVFAGGEASDAPDFTSLSERRCCADHLEEQLDPVRTAGKKFALAHSPSRTATVAAAGGDIGLAPEPEYFRFVATSSGLTTIHTTLPAPDDVLVLSGVGDWRQVTSTRDFLADSDQPIHVTQVMASQDGANIPRGLPGGDPSLLVVPPREQFRPDYVILTPDKYAFDFVTIVAPAEAEVRLDEVLLDGQLCDVGPTDGLSNEERGDQPIELLSYRCQLSFATVDPDTGAVTAGIQNDGVHRIRASQPIGVTVFGFDAYVSYAYAGGTELREIAAPR